MAEPLQVQVVCVLPDRVFARSLALAAGACVRDALQASGVLEAFPELARDPRVGIYSRAVPLDQPLHDGDRVELYRPLLCDPKEARRRRAGRSPQGN